MTDRLPRRALSGALILTALSACGVSAIAEAAAPGGTLSARVAGRTINLPLASPAPAAVAKAVLAEFARCEDVPRMLVEPSALPAYRAEEHVELTFTTPTSVTLVPIGLSVAVTRLLVPLAGDRAQPDWFFYAQGPSTPSYGVYRQQGADPGRVAALRRLVTALK